MSLSEDDFTQFLIAAVGRRPVLYNVHLADYKNKNKKGEAFKSVQEEMKQLGSSEEQVQSTYKRWISLKRKFRVEFLKQLACERSGEGEDMGANATFPHYEKLTFLVPYCQHYKASKGKGRGRRKPSSALHDDNDDDDGDEQECSENSGIMAHSGSSTSNGLNNSIASSIDPLSLLTPTDIEAFKQKCLQHQLQHETMASAFDAEQAVDSLRSSSHTSTSCTAIDYRHQYSASSVHMECDDSENALFGQLVASELDKLPKAMHNLVRAQILFLIAQMARR